MARKLKQQHPQWQESFVTMLPGIQRRLRRAFQPLDFEARAEAVEEATVHCLVAFVKLHERGRAHVASASTLAYYATRQVRRGRPAAGRMNGKEPLSRYAQVSNGIAVDNSQWIDMLAEDKRASVPDQVAARMDVRAWFATLPRRLKQIATDLALGATTSEAANKYGVSRSRISQLRRTLEASWYDFQHQAVLAVAR